MIRFTRGKSMSRLSQGEKPAFFHMNQYGIMKMTVMIRPKMAKTLIMPMNMWVVCWSSMDHLGTKEISFAPA
jgi:hypothetical protein